MSMKSFCNLGSRAEFLFNVEFLLGAGCMSLEARRSGGGFAARSLIQVGEPA